MPNTSLKTIAPALPTTETKMPRDTLRSSAVANSITFCAGDSSTAWSCTIDCGVARSNYELWGNERLLDSQLKASYTNSTFKWTMF